MTLRERIAHWREVFAWNTTDADALLERFIDELDADTRALLDGLKNLPSIGIVDGAPGHIGREYAYVSRADVRRLITGEPEK